MIDNFCLQIYLTKPHDSLQKPYITSSHKLNAKVGRQTCNNIVKERWLCTFCDLNDVEDEFLLFQNYLLHSDLRKKEEEISLYKT